MGDQETKLAVQAVEVVSTTGGLGTSQWPAAIENADKVVHIGCQETDELATVNGLSGSARCISDILSLCATSRQ